MKDLININRLNRFGQNIWNRIKNTFMTKEDAINGVLVGQEWTLLESVVGNSPIILPSTDSFTELYIEMYSSNGTITHNINIRLDSILFESSNNEYREILLDSVYDAQTYVKYNFETNSIIPIMYEGNEITDSSNITTRVYTKTNKLEAGSIEAEKIVYDNSFSDVSANNVQGTIDEIVSAIGGTRPSKNFLPNNIHSNSQYGIICTVNVDKSITLNGTSTNIARVVWNLVGKAHENIYEEIEGLEDGVEYILSGSTEGCDEETYGIYAVCEKSDGTTFPIDEYVGNNVFTHEEGNKYRIYIGVSSNVTVNNVTLYPMIRKSTEDDTYVPYDTTINNRVKDMKKTLDKVAINSVVPKYKNYTLGAEGWYRIAKMECKNANEANGSVSNSCGIEIKRVYHYSPTEYKKIRLVSLYQSSVFSEELSKANANGDKITKIRHTVDTTNNTCYIEIYYSTSSFNSLSITMDNYSNAINNNWELIDAKNTSETVSGVNVLGSYNFSTNGIKEYDMTFDSNYITGVTQSKIIKKDGWAYGCFQFKITSNVVKDTEYTITTLPQELIPYMHIYVTATDTGYSPDSTVKADISFNAETGTVLFIPRGTITIYRWYMCSFSYPLLNE